MRSIAVRRGIHGLPPRSGNRRLTGSPYTWVARERWRSQDGMATVRTGNGILAAAGRNFG